MDGLAFGDCVIARHCWHSPWCGLAGPSVSLNYCENFGQRFIHVYIMYIHMYVVCEEVKINVNENENENETSVSMKTNIII